MVNIEAKYPFPTSQLPELRERLKKEAEYRWTRGQLDTFFDVPTGYLKIRQDEDGQTVLVAYHRDTDVSSNSHRPSDFKLAPVADGHKMIAALGHVLPKGLTVVKQRDFWMYQNTKIHVDKIDGLGVFVELETLVGPFCSAAQAAEECKAVIKWLQLDREKPIGVPYVELLRKKTCEQS